MTILVLAGTAPITTTTWVPGQPADNGFVIGVRLNVTTAIVAGTMTFTMSWTDPVLGAQSRAQLLVLTALGFTDYTFPVVLAAATPLTYALSMVGLIGTPAYNIVLMYSGAS